jgi:hypothetical protein
MVSIKYTSLKNSIKDNKCCLKNEITPSTPLRAGYEANKPFDCAQDDSDFRNTWTKDSFCAAE